MLIDSRTLDSALILLEGRLRLNAALPVGIVVCGGSALIATGLVSRTTKDVDIVALADESGALLSPAPLPEALSVAAREVALTLEIGENWLNNGPSSDEGGLFQTGLPEGLSTRLHKREYGSQLTVYFIDRVDQIYFKVFAAADRAGYHVDDLMALNPSPGEMEQAAMWAMTHDPSDGFRIIMKSMLEQLRYAEVAERI